MAEYVIPVKIDPSGTTSGAAKVKQDLAGIDTAAKATAAAIKGATDAKAFDNLVAGAAKAKGAAAELETGSKSLASAQSNAMRSMDAFTKASDKATDSVKKNNSAAADSAKSNAAMEASLRRVLQATDAEAAELQKLNALIAEAKVLFDAGRISQEQYAAVQKLAATAANGHTVSIGQQKQGVLQLGEQFRQFATEVTLGISPITAFTQQSGQAAFALTNMGGTAGKVGAFFAGGWGTLILVGVSILGSFAAELIKTGSALDDEVDKLKKSSEETETNRKAKELFKFTEQGVKEAIQQATDASRKWVESQRTEVEQTAINAKANLIEAETIRTKTKARLEDARALLQNQIDRSRQGGERGDVAGLGIATRQAAVNALTAQIADSDKAIAALQNRVQQTLVDLADEAARAAADPVERVKRQYEGPNGLIAQTKLRLVAEHATVDVMAAQLTILRQQEAVKVKAAQDAKKDQGNLTNFILPVNGRISSGFGPRTPPTAGASSFHPAIDIAAPIGTPVHAAAGGVVVYAGKLPGLGNAIIIDHGAGTITEYGHLSSIATQKNARVVQGEDIGAVGNEGISTGPHLDYRVKTGGRYVDPRSGRFRTDETQTDVRAANAAESAQKAADRKAKTAADAAARKADQISDYVNGVVSSASAKGIDAGQDTLANQIQRSLDELKRRFNLKEVGAADKKKITDALTDADARVVAERFKTAYIDPLQRLDDLQGKTGLDREILNAQLDEKQRRGGVELDPQQKQQIENSIRLGDARKREAQILEEIRQPIEEYKAQLAALNALLAKGEISQTAYNARVSDLGAGARGVLQNAPDAVDPKSGDEYSTISAREEEDARYAKEQQDTINNREQLLKIGIDYDALVEAQAQKHKAALEKIDTAVLTTRVEAAQSIADSLLGIAEQSVGKQNAVYKALFVASKAFAIADGIIKTQQAVAAAIAKGFPQNIPLIAQAVALGASVISNISSIALNLADGGLITGPGGPRDDRVPVNASNGEFMVNAEATARNRSLLEAINSGATVRQGNTSGGSAPAATAGGGGGRVTVQQHPGVDIETHENPTTGEVEIIARRMIEKHAGRVVARQLDQPNSPVSKSIRTNTTARNRKS